MTNPNETTDILTVRSLDLACRNIQHLLKIEEEESTRNQLAASLCGSMARARNGDPAQFSDMLSLTAHTIHATVQHYIGDANRSYESKGETHHYMKSESLMAAAQTQDRLIRTIETWRKLQRMEKQKPAQNEKQTRQNAPLDA